MPARKYHIALSFAGEDRAYVGAVADSLVSRDVKVFYDAHEEADLWGKNLYTHLSDVYQNQAEFTVMFISKSYAERLWTNHEREGAQARAFEERREYILPARFDDTEVPGVLKTVGYVDLRRKTPVQLADLLIEKLIGAELLETSRALATNNEISQAMRAALPRAPVLSIPKHSPPVGEARTASVTQSQWSASRGTRRAWRIRYVLIPLLVATIVAMVGLVSFIFSKGRLQPPGIDSTGEKATERAQPTLADLEREAIEQDAKVEELRQKTPPFGYSLAENCDTTWINFNEKRVWVRDAKGLICDGACSTEPLGVYIEEDKFHYYDAGVIKAFPPEEAVPPILEGCFPQLDGVCATSSPRVHVGETVIFKVAPYGGTGEYVYTWEGGEGELFARPEFVTSFSTAGKQSRTVRITSNGQNFYATCSVIVDGRGN